MREPASDALPVGECRAHEAGAARTIAVSRSIAKTAMMPYRVIRPRRKPPVLLPLSPARPAVAGVLDLAKTARTIAQYLAREGGS